LETRTKLTNSFNHFFELIIVTSIEWNSCKKIGAEN